MLLEEFPYAPCVFKSVEIDKIRLYLIQQDL
jgi:hypothetical protein